MQINAVFIVAEYSRKDVADQQSELSHSTREKGLQKLTREEQKRNFLQKIARPSLEDFLAEIDVIFKNVFLKYLMWITLTSNKVIYLISYHLVLGSWPELLWDRAGR